MQTATSFSFSANPKSTVALLTISSSLSNTYVPSSPQGTWTFMGGGTGYSGALWMGTGLSLSAFALTLSGGVVNSVTGCLLAPLFNAKGKYSPVVQLNGAGTKIITPAPITVSSASLLAFFLSTINPSANSVEPNDSIGLLVPVFDGNSVSPSWQSFLSILPVVPGTYSPDALLTTAPTSWEAFTTVIT